MRRLMFTITGPSCAGKTTLLARLLEDHPDRFARVVSDTTRSPRLGEVDGEEYSFLTETEFKKNLREGKYCQHVHFAGTYYGTRIEVLEGIFESGRVPVRVVEPTGVNQFREVCAGLGAEVFSIFVNEDVETLIERWLDRVMAAKKPDVSFYAHRIAKTVIEETQWATEPLYDYYMDLRDRNEAECIYELSRIATGSVLMQTARKISPNPLAETSA